MSSAPPTLFLSDRIWSGSPPRPAPGALVASGGRIRASFALPTRSAASRMAREARLRLVDLRGCDVLPGFTDSHLHLLRLAESLAAVDLSGLDTEAALRALATAAATVPGPLRARGLEGRLARPGLLGREALDRIAPDRPLLIETRDLHGAFANSAALLGAGLAGPVPAEPGLERRAGRATGYLREHPAWRVAGAFPRPAPDRRRSLTAQAIARLHRDGIVAIHDFDGLATWEGPSRDPGLPPLRYRCFVLDPELEAARQLGLRTGSGRGRRRIGGLKLFLDGSLGSGTAWLADGTGLALLRGRELDARLAAAREAGLAPALHAIGDGAVAEAAAACARVGTAGPARIEHCEILPQGSCPGAGLVASLQPLHAEDDAALFAARGDRLGARAFGYRRLVRAGAMLILGSDAPVVRSSVLEGIARAIDPGRAESLSLGEALEAYTVNPARLYRERRGRLGPGMAADLVAVEGGFDPGTGPSPGARVVGTWVAGARVFPAGDA